MSNLEPTPGYLGDDAGHRDPAPKNLPVSKRRRKIKHWFAMLRRHENR